jgi:molybdate transport system ATP-binding protein
VDGVEGFGDRIRVRVIGTVPVVAEVTAAAAADLDLADGAAVWASVKASEVELFES